MTSESSKVIASVPVGSVVLFDDIGNFDMFSGKLGYFLIGEKKIFFSIFFIFFEKIFFQFF